MSRVRAATLVLLLSAVACGAKPGPTVKIGKDIELALARACVVAGEDQTLHARSPDSIVLFEAKYADGESGTRYGGADSEIVQDAHPIEKTWRVSDEAPPGPVVVEVGILKSGDQKEAKLRFKVVRPNQSCE